MKSLGDYERCPSCNHTGGVHASNGGCWVPECKCEAAGIGHPFIKRMIP